MTYLSGENLVAGYGGADILHGCSIDVGEGEIAVIVGPNGSGKSTAMKAIFGMLNLKSGNVKIKGEGQREDKKISLDNLNYWNVETQEAYYSYKEAHQKRESET